MLSLTGKQEKIYLTTNGDYVFGSFLISGGKDEKGNYKASGFMKVRFSGECQDAIYVQYEDPKTEEVVIPHCITADFEGFLSWNEWNETKEVIAVINKISNIKEYVKPEEKPKTTSKPSRRIH